MAIDRPGMHRCACSRCGDEICIEVSPALADGGALERCAACGEQQLFRQKSFNRAFGIAVVGVAIVFAPLTSPPYISLFIGAGVDGLVYLLVPWIGICYNCETEYRGTPAIADLERFDHTTAQRIQARQERIARQRTE